MRFVLGLLPCLLLASSCGVPPCGEPSKPLGTVHAGKFRSAGLESDRLVVVEDDFHVTESFTRDGHSYVVRYKLVERTYSR